jgi:predicted TIM-barrel fold metal-dependent hydrolase
MTDQATIPRIHSADSHVLEPQDLWEKELPSKYTERALKVIREGNEEVAVIDGIESRRARIDKGDSATGVGPRPPGHSEPSARLDDLDDQGICAELLFPSLGLWIYRTQDAELAMAHARLYNDWLADQFLRHSDRFVGVAILPVNDTDQAIAELHRVADMGFQGVNLPIVPPDDRPYNDPVHEPLWDALSETGLKLCAHTGTGSEPIIARGLGGAVINFAVNGLPPQAMIAYLVGSGVLDRHPDLHVVLVEGGASWLPALMEHMDEGYIQHGRWARPALSAMPSEIARRQVHVSFQHDRAVLYTIEITGTDALLWGSDYPHLEGTWPNTKSEIEKIFDGVDDVSVRHALLGGSFEKLFKVPAATA